MHMSMTGGRIKAVQNKQRTLSMEGAVGDYKAMANGEVYYASKELMDIFECAAPGKMISDNIFSWSTNENDGQRMKNILARSGNIDSLEIESLTRKGRVIHLLISASMSMGVIQGTIKDITEIRQLDDRLLQSQKLESLGTLAGGIAHDFNNILGIIQGHLMILERHQDDPVRCAKSMLAIRNATDRGASLAKQIITFARERSVAWAEVAVNDIVTELAKFLLETLPRSISISTFLEKSEPHIAGDSHLIHQMLFNLCINARDAMPNGGSLSITTDVVDASVCLNIFPAAASVNYVRAAVADTGIGIDEATLQRVFEPFFTTKTPDKGTGLGLAMVQSIIDSHHGFVDVQSTPGAGTTFSVYIPVYERVEETPVEAEAGEISGGSETILFVEDEERIRELVETILAASGYTILSAGDGEEGLQKYMDHHSEIDLIISDLGLPKLGGADMLEKIKAFDPAARVVVVSGFFDQDVKARIQGMGIHDILTKPYMPDVVMRKVREVLDAHE